MGEPGVSIRMFPGPELIQIAQLREKRGTLVTLVQLSLRTFYFTDFAALAKSASPYPSAKCALVGIDSPKVMALALMRESWHWL